MSDAAEKIRPPAGAAGGAARPGGDLARRGAYTVHRPVVNEYLVRERDRRRLRDLGKVLLVLAPLALALTAFTWIHLQVLDAGYRIDFLERELHELEREESRLRLEAAYLANPGRIERLATDELGMRPPEIGQVVFPQEILPPADAGAGAAEPVPERGSSPAEAAR